MVYCIPLIIIPSYKRTEQGYITVPRVLEKNIKFIEDSSNHSCHIYPYHRPLPSCSKPLPIRLFLLLFLPLPLPSVSLLPLPRKPEEIGNFPAN
mmetsp:Transcript_21107/g.22528  ORF Transcript_21107/g.22528 Transcript_21107/m.22528 type:complete len:94 (-) Transcript_21107:83-364(-)